MSVALYMLKNAQLTYEPDIIMSNHINVLEVNSSPDVETVDLWKRDARELNFDCHGKGCEYLSYLYFLFVFQECQANVFW